MIVLFVIIGIVVIVFGIGCVEGALVVDVIADDVVVVVFVVLVVEVFVVEVFVVVGG